jgi:uncharacterized protein (DUF433 family)
MDKNRLERITIDPGVLCGKPVIKGTRISVELILEKLVQGYSYQKTVKEYDIQEEDIKAALLYAQKTIANEEVYEAI